MAKALIIAGLIIGSINNQVFAQINFPTQSSYKYLKGINDFSILEPRFVNISFYYKYQAIQAGLTHRFTPKLETEWVIMQRCV